MKTINKILTLILAVAISTGCNKKLDVTPGQNITPEQITNGDDVKAVLFGAYSLLQGPSGFGERFQFASDLLASTPNATTGSDYVVFAGTFADYRDLPRKSHIDANTVASGMWANSYTIINICNTVLDKIDLVDADERDAIEGEAKLIRGMVYFQLVNYFGLPYSDGNANANPGVPLVLEPVYEYDEARDNPARSTVAQVYTQVLADLNDASTQLPQEEIGANGRGDYYTAYAFLSRVHLNMLNYAAAAQAATVVIESGEFGLNLNFSGAFNNANNTREDVFAIQQTSQSNAGTTNNGINTFYAAYTLEPPLISGRGDAQASSEYVDRFEPNDVRGQFFYTGANIAGVSGIYTYKWEQFYKAVPIVRLAEMYLTRAEANFRNASVIGATPLEDLNEVRSRAGASLLLAVTADAIIEERYLELGFEGDRLWTLKRFRRNVGTRPYNDSKLILPIPLREMDVNQNLVQNPDF